MYAIIRAGGKQAKVSEGDVIDVERIKATDEITFTPLLVVGDDGTVISDRDALAKSKVVAEIVGEHRGDKVEVFKYKNKSGYRRRQGHRQTYTTIQVTSIEIPGAGKKTAKSSAEKAPAKTAAKKASAEKASAEKASAEKASAEKASAKTADEKASAEKAPDEKAPAKKASAEKAATKTESKAEAKADAATEEA